jgi:hypothetical protein
MIKAAMNISKKYFHILFFIIAAVFLFSACNLGVAKPDANLPPTLSIETSVMLTVTAMSVSSPTSTFTPTPAITLTPSPTTTLFFAPTVTSTQRWTGCPGIVITPTKTDVGNILHILRCEDGLEYDLGPLANGSYAVGPNDKFLVYISFDGIIYIARIGERYLKPVFSLRREKIFTVFIIGDDPDFEISFVGDAPKYKLILLEKKYYQKRDYGLPADYTQ